MWSVSKMGFIGFKSLLLEGKLTCLGCFRLFTSNSRSNSPWRCEDPNPLVGKSWRRPCRQLWYSSSPYSKSIYGPYMEIYIWSISGADMGFVSGFNKNWADITWYNIKAIYGPYKILYGLNFIWDRYGTYMENPYMSHIWQVHICAI